MDEENQPVGLVDILNNAVVFREIAPYLPVADLLHLSATSKTTRLICTSSEAWRYLDLSSTHYAQIEGDALPIDIGGVAWRSQRMDESLTEDDFYAGPLRGIFNRLQRTRVLQFVQNLVLDGLTVPADLVREIIAEDRFNVRILSLREAKHLNHNKLQQILRYAVRPTRPEGTPRLRAMYLFGAKNAPGSSLSSKLIESPSSGVMSSLGAQIGAEWNQRSTDALATQIPNEESRWYGSTGRAIKKPSLDWPETLQACMGIICFDAVLCRGPRHDITKVDSKEFLQPAIASVALGPSGCEVCRSCPEGSAVYGESSDSALPLLGPVPSHASALRVALRPSRTTAGGYFPRLILRCEDCLRGRWCEQCNKWWCEDCYQEPVSRLQGEIRLASSEATAGDQNLVNGVGTGSGSARSVKIGVHRDCFGCGRTCAQCKGQLIRQCRNCTTEFCLVHDDHCSQVECGWCNSTGRRTRELY